MSAFKVGDFVLFTSDLFLEHLYIVKIHEINNKCVYTCLSIEALNNRSKKFVGSNNEFTIGSFHQLALITDKEEIDRLNKLMVFK